MFQKNWKWILVAVICLLVLGVTLWAVLGGVSSQLPQDETPPVVEQEETPQEPLDENYPMVDESGVVIGEDNLVDDPWADVAEEETEVPQGEVSEIPQEEVVSDEDLAVTDEGWSGIY